MSEDHTREWSEFIASRDENSHWDYCDHTHHGWSRTCGYSGSGLHRLVMRGAEDSK